jgi:hypothetical protein
MLDEKVVVELIEKLRALFEKDANGAADVLDVLRASYLEDKGEPVEEIAKTICEILEPERIGGINWLACRGCQARLNTEEDRERGLCDRCLVS